MTIMNKKLLNCPWMRCILPFLRDSIILITCMAAFLWLAKCPGNLEWWRPICMGALLPIMKRVVK